MWTGLLQHQVHVAVADLYLRRRRKAALISSRPARTHRTVATAIPISAWPFAGGATQVRWRASQLDAASAFVCSM